jgi:hypothetical protein
MLSRWNCQGFIYDRQQKKAYRGKRQIELTANGRVVALEL